MNQTFVIKIAAQDTTTAIAKKIEAQLNRLPNALGNVTKAAARLSSGGYIDKLEKQFTAITKRVADMAWQTAKMVPAFSAITGLASVAGVAGLATSFGKTATQLKNTAAGLAMSTQELQRYRQAAQFAGLESTDMDGALASLGANFESTFKGNNGLLAVMQQFGIVARRSADGSINVADALAQVARAAASITNQQARREFLDMFGVGALTPMVGRLDELIDRARKLGAVIGSDGVEAGMRFEQKLVAARAATDNFVASISIGLLPIATKVVDKMTAWTTKNREFVGTKVAEYAEKIATAVAGIDWDAAGTRAGSFIAKIEHLVDFADRLVSVFDVMRHPIDAIKRSPASAADRDRTGVLNTLAPQSASSLFAGLEKEKNLPAGLLDAVWAQESGRGTNMTSSKGAQGHFQFMPATAAQYGLKNPNDLRESATAAAQMLSDLLSKYGGSTEKALAAYNWGQGNVDRQGMGAMPAETSDYIRKIRRGMGASGTASGAITQAPDAASSPSKVEMNIKIDGPPGTTATVRATGDVTSNVAVGRTQMAVGGAF